MNEAPHKLLFSISLKMRQLLAARICADRSLSRSEMMDICGIRHEFQAGILMETAGKTTLASCCNAVLCCAETAYELNSTAEPESRIIELVLKLASLKGI